MVKDLYKAKLKAFIQDIKIRFEVFLIAKLILSLNFIQLRVYNAFHSK